MKDLYSKRLYPLNLNTNAILSRDITWPYPSSSLSTVYRPLPGLPLDHRISPLLSYLFPFFPSIHPPEREPHLSQCSPITVVQSVRCHETFQRVFRARPLLRFEELEALNWRVCSRDISGGEVNVTDSVLPIPASESSEVGL